MIDFITNSYLVRLFVKWKIHLIIITALAVVLAFIFSGSYFIKPKFKSTLLVYPSNIIPYSSETPTEQLLQLFNSEDVKEELINKFNLVSHYEINSTSPYTHTYVMKELESNVNISKTEYESVKIEVFDTDPKIACEIANTMNILANAKARNLQRSKTKEVVVMYKEYVDSKKKQVDSLDNVMKALRIDYGILDYDKQAREVTKAYLKSGGTGKASQLYVSFQEKGSEFITTREHLWHIRGNYEGSRGEYEHFLRDLTKQLTYTNIIASPIVADKKSYPVRWLIVLVSAISALVLSILFVAILDNTKR